MDAYAGGNPRFLFDACSTLYGMMSNSTIVNFLKTFHVNVVQESILWEHTAKAGPGSTTAALTTAALANPNRRPRRSIPDASDSVESKEKDSSREALARVVWWAKSLAHLCDDFRAT